MTDPEERVILTRKRWDAYMLPLFVASVILGAILFIQTRDFRGFTSPFGVVLLWLLLRLKTPPAGLTAPTIRSTPGAVVLLWWMAATLAVAAVLIAVDIFLIGHPFGAPLEAYHALLLAPPFVTMFTGAYFAGRLQEAARREKS